MHIMDGEGNGNPLQCSCLENPRDGGAWWAAVYGVAQSRTRLKQLSSSSTAYNGRLHSKKPWKIQQHGEISKTLHCMTEARRNKSMLCMIPFI